MMLSLKTIAKNRALLSPVILLNITQGFSIFSDFSSSSTINQYFHYTGTATTDSIQHISNLNTNDVVLSFKEWFRTRRTDLIDRIFEILRNQNDDDLVSRCAADLALSQLGISLSESLVLEVLKRNDGSDVLSCLKFFDWAGRQQNFHHTRATFHAIFKILSRAKLMSLTLDFLENYRKHRYVHQVRFYDTLVLGYAIAGKPDIALQLFGKMRFQGLDLDAFAYHVLLNALVEASCFDAVDAVSKQISLRGFQNSVTRSIMLKSLCKQNQVDEAEAYVHKLVHEEKEVGGHVLCIIVDTLCKRNNFERAGKLLEEFRDLGLDQLENAYGVWLRNLVQAGKLDGALEFLKTKKSLEGYVPEVFRYNVLVSRLLRENRLLDVFDLLMEMKDGQISPDKVTMNTALCFFCKAGMVDVALQLYDSRIEFGLSPNSLAYNYLINTLCGDGSIDEAYSVLKNSIDQGFFPRKKIFSILADALCKEGKLDKMKELIIVALERNFMPSDSTYDKFISALCRAKKVEDGYLIHGELSRINKVTTKETYSKMILGFIRSSRGDIAARLIIEMQEKGYNPSRLLFRYVICALCKMENPEKQFWQLLEMQLSRNEPNLLIYNFFIDGAGHAKRPDLAREVYEMMNRSGIEPNLSSDILMLQSYLKSERIADALNFFSNVQQRREKIGRKLYNTMVVGLCKANKADIALDIMGEMRNTGSVPSHECYEELIKLLCSNQRYDIVVKLVIDLKQAGRRVSSFIGNILLLHSFKGQDLYDAWTRFRDPQFETSEISLLGQLIAAFSGRMRVSQDIDNLEEVIEQCFPLDTYTYNMLLRRLCMVEMNCAFELFNRMRLKGYEPNQWSYEILVRGLHKWGRSNEAKSWVEEMFRKGVEPTVQIKHFL